MRRVISPETLLITLALSVAAPAPAVPAAAAPPAASAPAQSDYRAAREKLVEERKVALEEYADWCHGEKAYLARDKAYEALLPLDPEHKKARRYLKYTYDRKGKKWYRRRPYKAPKAGKPEVVAEAEKRRVALDDAYIAGLVELLEEHEEALGPVKVTKEYEWLLEQAPDNADVREALGYVAVEQGGKTVWKTQAVLDTEEARDEIAEWLAEERDDVPDLEPDELEGGEEALDIEWGDPVSASFVRVVHNVESDEAEAVAENTNAQWGLLPKVLGGKSRAPRAVTVYLIDGSSSKDEFISRAPHFNDDSRESLRQTGGVVLSGPSRVICNTWSDESVVRIDASAKQTTTAFLGRTYGINSKIGWVVEGAGAYINLMVVGTRLTTMITRTEYDEKSKGLSEEIADPDSDWIAIAIEVLEEAKPTRMADTLGRNSNEMTPEDYTIAYSLVSYLREGLGVDVLEDVLKEVGKGEASSVVVLEEILERPLPRIQADLLAYLREVGGHDY